MSDQPNDSTMQVRAKVREQPLFVTVSADLKDRVVDIEMGGWQSSADGMTRAAALLRDAANSMDEMAKQMPQDDQTEVDNDQQPSVWKDPRVADEADVQRRISFGQQSGRPKFAPKPR